MSQQIRRRFADMHSTVFPVGLVKMTTNQVEPSVGVIAGLLALIMAFWNLHIVVLFIFAVIAGGFDLVFGARRVHMLEKEDKAKFDYDKLNNSAISKVLYLVASFFLGMTIDTLVTLTGGAFDLGFTTPFKVYTPVTAAMIFWRLTKELASIARNIDQTPGGRGQIWPAITKIIDNFRFQMINSNPDTAGREPNERWSDNVTPEERELIERVLAENRAKKE